MSRILFTVIIVSLMIVGCTAKQPEPEPKTKIDVSNLNMELEAQIALQEAKKVYEQAVEQGLDLSAGPCLSNAVHGNPDYPETMWVFDIAHFPRQDVDDRPENQCSAFREGKAKNFIEFTPEGQLIEVYSPLL